LPEETVASDEIPDICEILRQFFLSQQFEKLPSFSQWSCKDVSVRELLFAIARDAGVNIDVHPDVIGAVSIQCY